MVEVSNMLVVMAILLEFLCPCILLRQSILRVHLREISLKPTHHASSNYDDSRCPDGGYCLGRHQSWVSGEGKEHVQLMRGSIT
jgi:hypothetical protein